MIKPGYNCQYHFHCKTKQKFPRKCTSWVLAENFIISFETEFLPFLYNNHGLQVKGNYMHLSVANLCKVTDLNSFLAFHPERINLDWFGCFTVSNVKTRQEKYSVQWSTSDFMYIGSSSAVDFDLQAGHLLPMARENP